MQTCLNSLPPGVKPRPTECYSGALTTRLEALSLRDRLLSNATETVKAYGPLLYREGSGPTGVWLVSLAIEKWTSLGQLDDSKTRGQPSDDPVLLHGSTLGLYEVLTGKPYICDMIMNPLVHYFFIEAKKIEQLRHSDPFVDALLWKESALVIAKLFTPGIFEKMTMHEMRLLNAEASSMNDIYNVGEDIVLEQNYVGILLEGILKTKDQNMIASPGVLLPPNIHSNYGQNSSVNHEDNYYTSPSYQVEARARIIFFKTGRPLSETNQHRSSSDASDISLEEIITDDS